MKGKNMKKEIYNEAEIELIELGSSDVIATSVKYSDNYYAEEQNFD